ncbi:DUF2073 domain-containing protein [Candidatus Micrarchaeota archaeon]|nr:DUF2073 domain-containing protein [Candidatus Micrarchaeota archaeon]
MKISLEFVSNRMLESMGDDEKLKFILKNVKESKILVLEKGLTRQEERRLFQRTMEQISKSFPGIEISSFGEEPEGLRSRLIQILGGKTQGITIVGPSNLVKEIKRDPDKLRVLAELK